MRAVGAEGQGHARQAAGFARCAQRGHQRGRAGGGHLGVAEFAQVVVAGLEPVGAGGGGAHGPQIGGAVVGHPRAQVHVDAERPAQRARRVHQRHHLVAFGRDQHQRAGVQDAGRAAAQPGDDLVHPPVAIGHTLAVEAVVRVAVDDMHHGQRGGLAARSHRQAHTVALERGAKARAEAVGRQRAEIADHAATQRGGAREVGRAAALHGQEAAVGPGEAVHQRLADDDDFARHGATPSVAVSGAAGLACPCMPVDERRGGGL